MKRPLALAAVVVVALVLLGGVLGFLLYTHLALGIPLRDQAGLLRLPPVMQVRAKATNTVAIRLNGMIDATVPFKQTVQLPLNDSYPAQMVLDTVVPLRFTIHYQGRIPIHAEADVEGTTDLVLHRRFLPKFHLHTKVPLDFEVPVSLSVPVDTPLHLVYRGPIRFAINQTLNVPMDTELRTRFRVDRDVQAPILASFGLRVEPPAAPVPIVVRQADLKLSLSGLHVQP